MWRRNWVSSTVIAASLALGFGAENIQAGIIFNSVNNVSSTDYGAAWSTTWLAQQFTTDGKAYNLNSVVLFMKETNAGGARVDLYSNVSNKPGSSLGILTSPGSYSPSLGLTTFTASAVSLAANTSYWVVLRGVGAGTYEWSQTTTPSDYMAQSVNSGVSWLRAPDSPYQMQVNATAVPEPASLTLCSILVSVGAAVGWRRRRRKERKAEQAAVLA